MQQFADSLAPPQPAPPTPASQQAPYVAPPGPPRVPPHTQTQSTLAPTAEFTRIFLLAWIIRYIFRGASGALFEEAKENKGLRNKFLNILSSPGRTLQGWMGGDQKYKLPELEAAAYSASIGVGSGALTWRYGQMVKTDILNLFRESVAEEQGIPQEQVTFDDIKRSNNVIIKRTVENYHSKMGGRFLTDGLFIIGAWLRSGDITDLLLGVKGVQIFADTWKRKTSMFEDLVSFVNNKINPRNGLGQPVSVGELFDLYQHYAEAFHPDQMFRNVLDGNPADIERWRQCRPMFQRMTELMNQTYAYKHTSAGNDIAPFAQGANFALPKLIYLLGNDFIDPSKPDESLVAIEVANKHGIPAAKHLRAMLKQGQTIEQVQQHFGIQTMPATKADEQNQGKNAVIAKGSTMQLEEAPAAQIDASTIAHTGPELETQLSPV